jgi:hypothetical protein
MQLYSSVGKVTGYELDNLGSVPGRNRDFFSSAFTLRYLRQSVDLIIYALFASLPEY